MAAQTLDDLPTPALILDRAILRRNLKRMSERLRNAGVMLRPHVKTAKSIEVASRAVNEDPLGTPLISNWNRVTSAIPEFLDTLRAAVEEDNK